MAIPYIGGKSQIAGWVVDQFPDDHQKMTYVEVFGGAAWVMQKKPASPNEVYNDLDENLVNMFTVIRDQFPELRLRAEWTFHSRVMFERALERLRTRTFDSTVDRALCFAIARVQSFAGMGSTYGYSRGPKSSGDAWTPFLNRLESIRDRFRRVNIERLDFERLITKYDEKTTLFYLDPPYVEKESYYDVPFGREDHERLAATLRKIRGRFALSYYPHPELAKLYKGFRMTTREAVKSSCGVTRTSRKTTRPKAVELLVRNY